MGATARAVNVTTMGHSVSQILEDVTVQLKELLVIIAKNVMLKIIITVIQQIMALVSMI